eukprot:63215-Prorocentrum_minimum.AAC.1
MERCGEAVEIVASIDTGGLGSLGAPCPSASKIPKSPESPVSKGVLPAIGNVQESVVVLVLLVDGGHERGGGGKDVINEDENGLFRGELNPLTNDVHELPHREVHGHQ